MNEKMKLITKFFAALLQCLPELSNEVMQAWIENPKALQEVLKGLCQPPIVYLRQIFAVTISATDGLTLDAKEVFNGGIYGLIQEAGLRVSSEHRPATECRGHELKEDGRYDQFFPSLVGGSTKSEDLRQLCLEWSQVIKFCREHSNKLRRDGCSTSFLLESKKEKGVFFVVSVYFDSDNCLCARVRFLSYDGVWGARCRRRVVTSDPTLKLES